MLRAANLSKVIIATRRRKSPGNSGQVRPISADSDISERQWRRLENGEIEEPSATSLQAVASRIGKPMEHFARQVADVDAAAEETKGALPKEEDAEQSDRVDRLRRARRHAVRPLTAATIQSISTTPRNYEDMRFKVAGKVRNQAPPTPMEQLVLCWTGGTAACFDFSFGVGRGACKVTIYAERAGAMRMQHALEFGDVFTGIVMVRVVEHPPDHGTFNTESGESADSFRKKWRGFKHFGAEHPRWWALVLEDEGD